MTNALEGESSAKYKTPLSPCMRKTPRGARPSRPIHPSSGAVDSPEVYCEQHTNKAQRAAGAARLFVLGLLCSSLKPLHFLLSELLWEEWVS